MKYQFEQNGNHFLLYFLEAHSDVETVTNQNKNNIQIRK